MTASVIVPPSVFAPETRIVDTTLSPTSFSKLPTKQGSNHLKETAKFLQPRLDSDGLRHRACHDRPADVWIPHGNDMIREAWDFAVTSCLRPPSQNAGPTTPTTRTTNAPSTTQPTVATRTSSTSDQWFLTVTKGVEDSARVVTWISAFLRHSFVTPRAPFSDEFAWPPPDPRTWRRRPRTPIPMTHLLEGVRYGAVSRPLTALVLSCVYSHILAFRLECFV